MHLEYKSTENFDDIFSLREGKKNEANEFFKSYSFNSEERIRYMLEFLGCTDVEDSPDGFYKVAIIASEQLLQNPIFTTGELIINKAFIFTEEIFSSKSLSSSGLCLSHDLARYFIKIMCIELPFVTFEVSNGKFASYMKHLPVLMGKRGVWCVTEVMARFNWILRDKDEMAKWSYFFKQTVYRLSRD